MPPPRLPNRSRFLWLLQLSLVAGGIYDLFFAGMMLLAPELPQRMLELRPPGDAFYLWLIAVFLTMLAFFYLFAAYDPVAYEGNVLVAIGGRLLGAAVMGFAAWRDPSLWGLWALAGGDAVFALAHTAFYLPLRPLVTH
jgi:hypothetical protein